MMTIPAYKNTTQPPGQIVNRVETTLVDYIARKQSEDTLVLVHPNVEKLAVHLTYNTEKFIIDAINGPYIDVDKLEKVLQEYFNSK